MKKRTIFPRRRLAKYEQHGGWYVEMAVLQRHENEKQAFEILVTENYYQHRRTVAYTPEHAQQAFTEARHYVAVEIAKQAMGISPTNSGRLEWLEWGKHKEEPML